MAASTLIPSIVLPLVSDRAKQTLDIVQDFVENECIPADVVYEAQLGEGDKRWNGHPPIMDDLKKRAQKLGLWNMFMPGQAGANFTNLEYGLMAEYLGKSVIASEATNCSAPDTGNMEVLHKYGTAAQKERWLKPLLAGQIRSAFLMTEPDIASSDATNIQLSMTRVADDSGWILNGSKWWATGAGDVRCKVYIVMGKSSPQHSDTHKQQSVMLVPADTPGITVERMLHVYGYDEAPHGHAHIAFRDVKVPDDAMVLGEGRGFEIIQGRLGPGRIHHAMRTIGAAERAFDWMISRVNDEQKRPFGKLLREHGVIVEWIARSRVEIDAARLMVLNAANKIDMVDAKGALKEIGEAKIMVPSMALVVIDRAVQSFGAKGICQDTPLAYLWAYIRHLRFADGPDEVHLQQLGQRENKNKKDAITARLAVQKQESERLMRTTGTKKLRSHL